MIRELLRSRWLYCLLAVTAILVLLAYQYSTPYSLDIGAIRADDDLLISGFHQRESSPTDDYKWTASVASVRMPGMGRGRSWTLVLHLSGYRPPDQASPLVAVAVNDHQLASFTAKDGMTEYDFPIPAQVVGWTGDLLVEIQSEAFSPEADSRELGLLVSRITVVPAGGGFVFPSPLTLLLVASSVLTLFVFLRWMGAPDALSFGASVALLLALAFVVTLHRQYATWYSWLVLLFLAGAVGATVALHTILEKLAHRTRWQTLSHWPLRPLLGILLLALACNLALAPTPGFVGDIGIYMLWAWKLTTGGLHSAYLPHKLVEPINYLPLVPYMFSVVGALYRGLFAPSFPFPLEQTTLLFLCLMKLPMIAANMGTGIIIFLFLRRRTSWRLALLSLAAYLFNPAILFNSAYGGQADAVHSFFAVLAVVLIMQQKVVGAWLSIAFAALSKPQGGLFLPLILFLTWRQLAVRAVLKGLLTASIAAAFVFSPFLYRGTGDSLLSYLLSIGRLDIPGLPAYTTMGAHNLWWVLGLGAEVVDTGGFLSQLPVVGGLATARSAGLALLAVLYAIGLSRLYRSENESWVPVVAGFLGFACYMSLTQVHETYAFSVLPFLALALPTGSRWRVVYSILTVTFLANMCLHDAALLDMLGLLEHERLLEPVKYVNALVNLGVLAYWTAVVIPGRRLKRRMEDTGVEARQVA